MCYDQAHICDQAHNTLINKHRQQLIVGAGQVLIPDKPAQHCHKIKAGIRVRAEAVRPYTEKNPFGNHGPQYPERSDPDTAPAVAPGCTPGKYPHSAHRPYPALCHGIENNDHRNGQCRSDRQSDHDTSDTRKYNRSDINPGSFCSRRSSSAIPGALTVLPALRGPLFLIR